MHLPLPNEYKTGTGHHVASPYAQIPANLNTLDSKTMFGMLRARKEEHFLWPGGVSKEVAFLREKVGKKRKDYASQVQLRALRKGPLTSKLARASPRWAKTSAVEDYHIM
eukprot:233971-Pelagomonas_calceolata.AAC.6